MSDQTRTIQPEGDPSIVLPSQEREELRGVVADFVARHASHESVRESAETDLGYSRSRWSTLAGELGIGALAVPEDLGGHGFGFADLAVVLEASGAALLPEPVLASAVVGCQALVLADEAAAVAQLRDEAIAGTVVLAVALDQEVALGQDVALDVEAGRTIARGTVPGVLWGAAADHLVVVGKKDGDTVLALVDLADVDPAPREGMDLTRRCADLHLDGAPARVLVGAARADEVLARLRLIRSAALASEHAGIAARLLEMTVEYVTQRQQFGRQIGSFQAVKHRIADMLVDRERARAAAGYAMAVLDSGAAPDTELAVAVAATVCLEAATRSAYEAIQLHGGIGFTWEHSAHFYLRRVLGDEGAFGSARRSRRGIAELVGV